MQHVPRNRSCKGAEEVKDYTNTEMAAAIDELIHNAKHRQMLKEKLIDGLTYAEIAERHEISERCAWTIICRNKDRLFKKLP